MRTALPALMRNILNCLTDGDGSLRAVVRINRKTRRRRHLRKPLPPAQALPEARLQARRKKNGGTATAHREVRHPPRPKTTAERKSVRQPQQQQKANAARRGNPSPEKDARRTAQPISAEEARRREEARRIAAARRADAEKTPCRGGEAARRGRKAPQGDKKNASAPKKEPSLPGARLRQAKICLSSLGSLLLYAPWLFRAL